MITDENRNLIYAIVASMLLLGSWHYLYEVPKREKLQEQKKVDVAQKKISTPSDALLPEPTVQVAKGRMEVLQAAPRIQIKTPKLQGSLRLIGGRIDDLTLVQYRETIDKSSKPWTLLSPTGGKNAYFTEVGWITQDSSVKVPKSDTLWQSTSTTLTPNSPVVLTWDNGEGLIFERIISVDKDYLFTIKQRVKNRTGKVVKLFPYGLISRSGTPETSGFAILHEGPIGYLNGKLEEIDYTDLQEKKKISQNVTGGWLGITDKYWLTALLPDQSKTFKTSFRDIVEGDVDRYQTDYLGAEYKIQPHSHVEITNHVFAGAKILELLDGYEVQLGVHHFDLAVDFGWFYIITKPIFHVLSFFHDWIGNFGVAILFLIN